MKVYLNTPEEVIKALKEGKEILGESGLKYTLMDGFIIGKIGNDFSVGTNIIHKEKPFILEEEPLKIEVSKWYETRGNQKARCFLIADNICHFTIDNYGSFITNTYGYYLGDKTSLRLNIIGPWKEDK